jgi:hypothetical protein
MLPIREFLLETGNNRGQVSLELVQLVEISVDLLELVQQPQSIFHG